ncbi:S-layer homology domain-containing protein [Inediibacterium massiliense]|uniref:S-layer homology domain-containing protein n=1 Tax=Inediibacterium massiliense TaxID=1658111 RepID=UPI0006B4D352|nr:S-layer homology domain-containing protein [Inediibacterium massiliense]
MKKIIKKSLCTLLTTCLIGITLLHPIQVDAQESDWAKPYIDDLKKNLDLSESLIDPAKFQTNITREEFAELAVLLFAKAKGIDVKDMDSKEPFTDTDNPYVGKAFNAKILKGFSDTEFRPKAHITREQIAVMLTQELEGLGEKGTKTAPPANFSDMYAVSDWAKFGINYITKDYIMNGVEGNRINPQGTTTREQAMTLLDRLAIVKGYFPKTETTPEVKPPEQEIPPVPENPVSIFDQTREEVARIDRFITVDGYQVPSDYKKDMSVRVINRKDCAEINLLLGHFNATDKPNYNLGMLDKFTAIMRENGVEEQHIQKVKGDLEKSINASMYKEFIGGYHYSVHQPNGLNVKVTVTDGVHIMLSRN